MSTRRKFNRALLTQKETQVVKYLTDGYSNKEVAVLLGLSRRTVEAHRARIMIKLGLNTFTSLVVYAIKNCLTSVDTNRSSGEVLAQVL